MFFDSLESRRHLSATLSNGVLKVTGNNKHEQISVQFADIPFLGLKEVVVTQLVVGTTNIQSKKFNLNAVKKIEIRSGGGNDQVGTLGSKKVPVFVDLGAGNDTFSGATIEAKVKLLGGAGNDVLNGGPKDDYVDGGAGDDTISTGQGNDTLIGGTGKDLLQGQEGNDVFGARDGALDQIKGDVGTDTATVDFVTGTRNPKETGVSGIERLK